MSDIYIMKPDDLFAQPPLEKPKSVLLFAGMGFVHSTDECFIIADGVEGLQHATEAEELARETALWAYTLVRQRNCYWQKKLLFLKRIFRSTNLRLWQKRRDPGFDAGLASALMVLMTIGNSFWVGSAGNCNSFLFRDGLIDMLTARDVDSEGMIVRAAGFWRRQLIPVMRTEKFLVNDSILLATDSVVNFISEDQMREILENIGTTQDSLVEAVDAFVDSAKAGGSTDTMSLCLVKRIVI